MQAARISSRISQAWALAGVALLLTSGCRAKPPRPDSAPPVYPAATTETSPRPPLAPVAAPPPVRTNHRIAVILGPGGAKAFAHVGVLRALQKQRVPIEKVVGLEWGALVGGLFAHHGQVHDVEWKLYKLEQQNLPRPKGLFGRAGTATGVKVMDGYLGDAFGRDEVAASKLKFSCPTRTLWAGVVSFQDRGSLRDVIKRCLGFPPVFNVEGSFLAGASQVAESIEMLKREGYDVIVLVNVLGSALPSRPDALPENTVHQILWQEVKRAVLMGARMPDIELINVDTNAYPITQFESGKELTQLGETAGNTAALRLVQKYGL